MTRRKRRVEYAGIDLFFDWYYEDEDEFGFSVSQYMVYQCVRCQWSTDRKSVDPTKEVIFHYEHCPEQYDDA